MNGGSLERVEGLLKELVRLEAQKIAEERERPSERWVAIPCTTVKNKHRGVFATEAAWIRTGPEIPVVVYGLPKQLSGVRSCFVMAGQCFYTKLSVKSLRKLISGDGL